MNIHNYITEVIGQGLINQEDKTDKKYYLDNLQDYLNECYKELEEEDDI